MAGYRHYVRGDVPYHYAQRNLYGSMLEVSSTLGILSEDITMGYYAAAAGMAVAYPIIPKIRAIATPKTMLLTDLILQIFLSYICARLAIWTSPLYAASSSAS